jgi:hypothetical protein
MKPYRLVDLYVPADCASAADCADVANTRGLSALVYVVTRPEQLPDSEQLSAIHSAGGCQIYPAFEFNGCGTRVLALLPNWENGTAYDALSTIDDAEELLRQIEAAGGTGLFVSPHADLTGAPRRDAPALAEHATAPGVICMVARSSRLVRDLDCEHASASGRGILAGTGPFGQLEDVGHFSTLLPQSVTSRAELIKSLRSGHGATLQMGQAAGEPPDEPAPKKRKRRRRRKRRGGKTNTSNQPVETSTDGG